MGEEIWKSIPGLHPRYEVSSLGRVRSTSRGTSRLLRIFKRNNGYCFVGVGGMGAPKTMSVHRLVVTAFIGPIPDMMTVDHINGVRDDNRVQNLRILSFADNNRAAHERRRERRGIVRMSPRKKFFMLSSGVIVDQDELLGLVSKELDPAFQNEALITAIFDSIVKNLRCNTVKAARAKKAVA